MQFRIELNEIGLAERTNPKRPHCKRLLKTCSLKKTKPKQR